MPGLEDYLNTPSNIPAGYTGPLAPGFSANLRSRFQEELAKAPAVGWEAKLHRAFVVIDELKDQFGGFIPGAAPYLIAADLFLEIGKEATDAQGDYYDPAQVKDFLTLLPGLFNRKPENGGDSDQDPKPNPLPGGHDSNDGHSGHGHGHQH